MLDKMTVLLASIAQDPLMWSAVDLVVLAPVAGFVLLLLRPALSRRSIRPEQK
jgi:hypothetical protein